MAKCEYRKAGMSTKLDVAVTKTSRVDCVAHAENKRRPKRAICQVLADQLDPIPLCPLGKMTLSAAECDIAKEAK